MNHDALEKAFIEHVKFHHGGVMYVKEESEADGCKHTETRMISLTPAAVAGGPPDKIYDQIEKAEAMVSALNQPHGTAGKREWTMSIPARPDHDPDLVIADALHAAKFEIARLRDELSQAITKYWIKHYVEGHCTLCGNSGLIDTSGVRTHAGVKVGRVNYCLCPNGQLLREAEGSKS